MAELEAIVDRLGRAGSYAMLRFAVDTADPANGALLARVQERATAVETKLLFFELEWAAIDDDRVDELLSADGLETTRHHLRTLRRYRPHLLSEPEEKLLTEKALTGRDAWTRLFSELTSAIRVELPDADEGVPLDVALSRLDVARPRGAPHDGGGGHRRARARPAHARLRLQHAAARQGRRRPPALVPELAGQPQPRQRGQRRVGAGAARGRALQLRPAAALVPPQGRAARRRPARRLRPHGLGGRRGGHASSGPRPATSSSPPSTSSRPCSATSPSASSTSAGSTLPCARTSAAAPSAPTRRPACTPS